MDFTTRLGLAKPEANDPPYITALDGNWETLDEAVMSGDLMLNAGDYVSGTGDHTAGLQEAIDDALAQGKNLFIPADTYNISGSGLSITENQRIRIHANGATFKAYADDTTILTISQGTGTDKLGVMFEGATIDADGWEDVIGVRIYDTDGAVLSLPLIKGCAIGILFETVAASQWVERCTIADTYITSCDVGIDHVKGVAAMPSFNEVALRDVGISSCGIGIRQGAGADFTRTTWDNVTVWVTAGQTGVEFHGRLDFARLQFGVEALDGATGSTGVIFGPTYTEYADPYSHCLEISFVGAFGNRVVDNAVDDSGARYVDGSNQTVTKYAPWMLGWKYGEAFPRMRLGPVGFEMGAGDGSPTLLFQTFYGAFFRMFGNILHQADPGFPTSASNGGAAEKSIHIFGTDDSRAGYIPVYTSSDGPAIVPSNAKTANYVLVASDAGKAITMNVASGNTLTVPPNSSVAFTVGTVITVEQLGAGATTITPGSGVTIRSRGALLNTGGQYARVMLRKIGTNEWLLSGDRA